MGSGVTIGEAVKLGCKVIGRDINPVAACLVETFLTEYDIRKITTAYNQLQDKLEKKYYLYIKRRSAARKLRPYIITG